MEFMDLSGAEICITFDDKVRRELSTHKNRCCCADIINVRKSSSARITKYSCVSHGSMEIGKFLIGFGRR